MPIVDLYPQPFAIQSSSKVSENMAGLFVGGEKVKCLINVQAKGLDDSAGSIYRMFRDLEPNIHPIMMLYACSALGTGASYSNGVYNSGFGGALVNTTVFAATLDFAAALADLMPGVAKSGMTAVAIANRTKRLYEHIGVAQGKQKRTYDIALTSITPGASAGTIVGMLLYTEE